MKLFIEFNQVGVTVLIASHALSLIKSLGYRTLVLQQGELIGDTYPRT
jgi:cell division transport system ATP-binding protein